MKKNLITFIALISFGVQAQQTSPIVRTASGFVRGASEDGIDCYKGIPYAAPPIGEFRWRPPQPVKSWDGIALATTTYDIDRFLEASLLGYDMPTRNSLDSVSDRDHIIEIANDISIISMHMSRISEEMIIWQSNEFKFIEISDKYSTGSSIMPQKKNPDMCELIRLIARLSFLHIF